MTEKLEPSRFEVNASYNSTENTRLARAIYPVMSWGVYCRFSAHRWAIKLIKADPKNGEECVRALMNFEHMVPASVDRYHSVPSEKAKYDKVLAIYSAWKARHQGREKAAA